MPSFEILCVTMHQKDFSKITDMNIHSDVVFANQADCTNFDEVFFDGHRARMVTTTNRGVGRNRNTALLYAEGDICLFADDDVVYDNDAEKKILDEFKKHPDADIFIFNLIPVNPIGKPIIYKKTRKVRRWNRMPWGSVRIAFRLCSIRKANLWFNTLFGGGCVFPSGEDSMWLQDARKKGLVFYVSDQTIGKIHYGQSSWFSGFDEQFYYGKGAYHQAVHPKMFWLWKYYVLFRFRGMGLLSNREKSIWIKNGKCGYKKLMSYDRFRQQK